MNEALVTTLKYLHLGGLLDHWDEVLELARQQDFSHQRLLEHVLEQECRIKREHARQIRFKQARIPELLLLETYPFARQPQLSKKLVLSLYDSLDYMTKTQNILWIGPTGCGKTGLATSFLIHAIEEGFSGRFVLFPELIEELFRSVADHSEASVMRRYLSCDCLLIDELGYVEVEPLQVGLFFTLMHKRHKKKTTLVTSNLGFSEWRSFLKNDHLTAALIDRLTDNSHVINMKKCRSLRDSVSPEP